MRTKARFAVPAIALTLAVYAFSQTLPQGVQKKASMGGITEYAFPTGCACCSIPTRPTQGDRQRHLPGGLPSRRLRRDRHGRTCCEHMDSSTTTNGRQIKKEIVDHGAAWNGTTSTTRTNYFETVTATDDNLKVGRWVSRPTA